MRHLTEKMLGYALARGLEPHDADGGEDRRAARSQRLPAQELVLGIVASEPFRKKRVSE